MLTALLLVGYLYTVIKKISFLGVTVCSQVSLVQGHSQYFESSFQTISEQEKNINTDDNLHQWELIQYLPMNIFLFFFCIFYTFVAFVLCKKNNEKLISLLKGKKKIRKHNFVTSLQRSFFSSCLSVQSCLRYGSQYQSGNIRPEEIKSGGTRSFDEWFALISL